MRSLILLFCFMFGFVALSNQVSYGDFSYDIDRFTVVSGSSTFVDEFDDGEEPPSGPSGSSTYSVSFGSFSSNSESGGVLNINSNNAGILGDEIGIDIALLDSTYYLISGSGGYVEVKISFPGGIETNSFFDLGIISSQPQGSNNSKEAVELSIAMDTPGVISAFFLSCLDDGSNEVCKDISELDITSSLGKSTDLTLRFDIDTANVLTASLDIGSDGSFETKMSGSHTLTFPGGSSYKIDFGPGMEIKNPTPDIKANNSDGPVSISTSDTLSVTVKLDSGSKTGEDADWWAVVNTPFDPPSDWYYYDLNMGWTLGLLVTHQGSLFDLPPFEVLSMSGLPTGNYTFYFGVDMVMNGSLDMNDIFYDSVIVNITP